MNAREFKEKWGLTQEQMATLFDTSRSTITPWLSDSDSGRSPSVASLVALRLFDFLFTVWMESDRSLSREYQVFLEAKEKGKGEAFRN